MWGCVGYVWECVCYDTHVEVRGQLVFSTYLHVGSQDRTQVARTA